MKKSLFFLLITTLLTFAACSQKPEEQVNSDIQNTPVPTAVLENTATPVPTEAPVANPTNTPRPTKTPRPTPTKRPTSTPIPTVTPAPTEAPVTPTPALFTYDRERTYTDNAPKAKMPNYLYNNDAEQGSVVKFTYQTKNYKNDNGQTYEKSALVYLPASYDENDTETKYNVLYLMHGGGDSPNWFLGGEGLKSKFTRMLDYMIYTGEIEPMIVCAVSYYEGYSNDATRNCIDFHYELMNDVVPLLETTYNTHAEDVTPEGLAASRSHRAFGGFSMGSVTTWSVFEHCLDAFAYFMPMSGDCWALGQTAGNTKSAQTAEYLAQKVAESGKTAEDFFIYSGCGTTDAANPNLTPQINAMKQLTDTFQYCDNFVNGNLYQCVVPGGHDINSINQILFHGVPKLFH